MKNYASKNSASSKIQNAINAANDSKSQIEVIKEHPGSPFMTKEFSSELALATQSRNLPGIFFDHCIKTFPNIEIYVFEISPSGTSILRSQYSNPKTENALLDKLLQLASIRPKTAPQSFGTYYEIDLEFEKFIYFDLKNTQYHFIVAFRPCTLDKDPILLPISLMQYAFYATSNLESANAQIYVDDLTSLYNSRYLSVCVEREIRRSTRFLKSFCLLFFDLDGFKEINDTYGHIEGNMLLYNVGAAIKEELREVDLIFRYGGDEFIVILVETSIGVGLTVANRFRDKLASLVFQTKNGQKFSISCSIGLASFPDHGHDLETLIRAADQSMYQDKAKLGKNINMAKQQNVKNLDL